MYLDLVFRGTARLLQSRCIRRNVSSAALAAFIAVSASAATLNVPSSYSFASAIAAAQPGDTILVADGVYTDAVVIDGANGTSAAPITIKAATVGGARIKGFSANASGNSKWIVSRSWWIIDGFRFGGTTPAEGIMTSTRLTVVRFFGASNTILRRCYFENCGSTSSNSADQANTHLVDILNGSASNVVERCEVKNSPSTGFHVVNTGSDINNVDNTFRYNFFTGNIGAVNGSGDSASIRIGVGTDAAKANPTNALIEHNLWSEVVSSQVLIYLKCGNNTVANNTFRDCAQGVTARRGPNNNFLGNYFFNSGGIRMREGGSPAGGGHTLENNYIEGALLDTTKNYRGIQIQAGQLEDGGNSGHVAMKYSTVRNNTVVYTGDNALTFGNNWNTTSVECNIVAPYENGFENNLFVNDAGQAVYRYAPGSACNTAYALTCPDPATNIWSGNVVWSVGSGTPGYTRSGITSNVDPQLTRDALNNWVGSVNIAGVSPADYGAHPPFRALTTADVGPGSTYVAGDADITNGLVGGWKFNEPDGSTTAADFSGNGFTATLKNGAVIAAGSADFDGGTELADVPYNVAQHPAQFSISLWARADALQGTSTALFKSAGGDGWASGFAVMQTTSGAALFRWGNGSAPDGSVTSANIAATTWRHIVGTYDGSAMRLYVNGALESTDATVVFGYNATPGSFVQFIGDSNGVANHVGQIDDVRVYNRALQTSEIGTLYSNGTVDGNTAPTISNIADQTIGEDGNTGALAFTVGDAETAAGSLSVTGSSSNTTLVPNGNIVFGGSGANRTVTVTPTANQSGSATITVTVSDSAASSSDTFLLTVNAVNDAPTISNILDQTISQGGNTGPLAFTVGDVETAAGTLTVTGSSSNTTLVPTANIVFGGSGANRTVTVTPAAGQSGTATITVTVSDGAASASDTFLLTVNSDITNGLAGWWKLNETSGTSASDSSGNGFTGALNGGAGWASGAVSLDGVNDYINVPYNAALAPANFTVSLWAKSDVVETVSTALFMSANGDGYTKGFAILVNAQGRAVLRWGNGTAYNGSVTGANTGTTAWRHIVATYGGGTMRLYVNGALEGTDTTVAFGYGGSGPQKIGDSNGVENYDGQEDDVRVYNRALSATEVSTLFNNGRK